MDQPAEIIVTRIREPASPWGNLRIESPTDVLRLWRDAVESAAGFEADKERLVVFALGTRMGLVGWNTVSLGSLNESIAHPREIFRPVIALAAHGFVLAHNHPSGDPGPSEADRRLTLRLGEAAKLLQIQFQDHVIVGGSGGGVAPAYFSFRESGLIG